MFNKHLPGVATGNLAGSSGNRKLGLGVYFRLSQVYGLFRVGLIFHKPLGVKNGWFGFCIFVSSQRMPYESRLSTAVPKLSPT